MISWPAERAATTVRVCWCVWGVDCLSAGLSDCLTACRHVSASACDKLKTAIKRAPLPTNETARAAASRATYRSASQLRRVCRCRAELAALSRAKKSRDSRGQLCGNEECASGSVRLTELVQWLVQSTVQIWEWRFCIRVTNFLCL